VNPTATDSSPYKVRFYNAPMQWLSMRNSVVSREAKRQHLSRVFVSLMVGKSLPPDVGATEAIRAFQDACPPLTLSERALAALPTGTPSCFSVEQSVSRDLENIEKYLSSPNIHLLHAEDDHRRGLRDGKRGDCTDERGLRGYDRGVREYDRGVREYDRGVRDDQRGVRGYDGGVRGYDCGVRGYDGGVRDDQRGVRGYDGGVRGYDGGVRGYDGGVREYDRGVREEERGVRDDQRGVRGYDGGVRGYDGGVRDCDRGVREYDRGVREEERGVRDDQRGVRGYDGGVRRDERGLLGDQCGLMGTRTEPSSELYPAYELASSGPIVPGLLSPESKFIAKIADKMRSSSGIPASKNLFVDKPVIPSSLTVPEIWLIFHGHYRDSAGQAYPAVSHKKKDSYDFQKQKSTVSRFTKIVEFMTPFVDSIPNRAELTEVQTAELAGKHFVEHCKSGMIGLGEGELPLPRKIYDYIVTVEKPSIGTYVIKPTTKRKTTGTDGPGH
jgi:hypothetical protein